MTTGDCGAVTTLASHSQSQAGSFGELWTDIVNLETEQSPPLATTNYKVFASMKQQYQNICEWKKELNYIAIKALI